MKKYPLLLSLIKKDELLSIAIDQYFIDENLLPPETKNYHSYTIEGYKLGELKFKTFLLSTQKKRKRTHLRFTTENLDLFTNSDFYFLNAEFKKEKHWLRTSTRYKSYCYLSPNQLIKIDLHNSAYQKEITIILESTPLEQDLITETNVIINGNLCLNELEKNNGFKVDESRQATKEEIQRSNNNRNLELERKISNILKQRYEPVDGLKMLEVFQPERKIHNLYCNDMILKELKQKGLAEGKNEIQLDADVSYCDDQNLIINKINGFQTKHSPIKTM